ncbi:hypothetical protein [Taklimakanibacter lacteus]|uniref:hypothetical protein n=1 Tax=Taklimakanibacter lacteus TaxID=2268456 RepID=UPI0013C40A1D
MARTSSLAMRMGAVWWAALLAPSSVAHCEVRETLISYRDWQVRSWETEGGEKWCIAEAKTDTQAFSIEVAETLIRVNFSDRAWSFGNGYADRLVLRVDQKVAWKFTHVQRVKDLMLLVLPDVRRGRKFIASIAKGSEVLLGGGKDKVEARYSIGGAGVAMAALADCEKLFLGKK